MVNLFLLLFPALILNDSNSVTKFVIELHDVDTIW
ncbi:MAG: hypothetical protein RLZZ91_1619 [Bacteroidota bacterium]|jgi:hypothetical protein